MTLLITDNLMKNKHLLLIAVFSIISISSCKKDDTTTPEPTPQQSGINLTVDYSIDNTSLYTDSFLYTSAAGLNYSINRFQYYLTSIKLIRPDNSEVTVATNHYFDAFDASTATISSPDVPAGNYIGVKFKIGVDSTLNYWDSLPVTVENTNMLWPLMMGGGYHFLKFEGYYKDAGNSYGYAMHLGTNACIIPITILKNITISSGSATSLNMHMNINEWLRNPNTFNFNTDGNYIMGDSTAMNKITQNGHDVFSF